MSAFQHPAIIITAIVCFTISHIVGEILEQRRRETKTGEFKDEEI